MWRRIGKSRIVFCWENAEGHLKEIETREGKRKGGNGYV